MNGNAEDEEDTEEEDYQLNFDDRQFPKRRVAKREVQQQVHLAKHRRSVRNISFAVDGKPNPNFDEGIVCIDRSLTDSAIKGRQNANYDEDYAHIE